MTALDIIVAKFRKASPNVASAFDEVQRRLTVLETPPVAGPPSPAPQSSQFGGLLPARLPVSSGPVVSVATVAELKSALATCAFGSVIDGGGASFDFGASLYALWSRDGNGTVTTLRNCVFTRSYMQIQGGRWFRLQDCSSVDSPYFGFKAEGSRYFEVLRCKANNAALSGFLLSLGSLDWQVWDSEAISCGGNALDHGIYAEAHNAQCVIANFLSVDHKGFGVHVSTDRGSQYPTDGLIVTGYTSLRGDTKAASVLYSTPGTVQKNVKLVGMVVKGSPGGAVYCYMPVANSNRLYGLVEWQSGAVDTDYQIANVAPVSVVNADPLIDANGRPAAGSPAANLVPNSMHGYLPALDKDGLPRLTADAGCYRVPG